MRLIPLAGTCTVNVPRFGPDTPCSETDLTLQLSTPPPPAPPLPVEPVAEGAPPVAAGPFAAGTSTTTGFEVSASGASPGAVPVTLASLVYLPALVST